MTPAARLAAAAALLDAFSAEPGARADALLRDWGRANRYAGSGDRAAIADRVYDCLRRWRSLGAAMAETGRGRVLASVALEGGMAALEALDFAARHAPPPPTPAERARLTLLAEEGIDAVLAREGAAEAVRLDWPDWLWPELARAPLDPARELPFLQRRAAFDLRVNTLKADPAAARARLAAEGVETEPGPLSPLALRVIGRARIAGLASWREGLVEPQDAASQAAALLSAARPGETVMDFCAGGGGKTLALAAMTANRATLLAHDVAPARMKDLPARLERAGARARLVAGEALGAWTGRCDLVFVDAPCSGSGAWAREPDAKWRLDEAALARLGQAQAQALDRASALVRPGGRLVYVTCSLLRRENADRFAAFLAHAPAFRPLPLAPAWSAAGLLGPAPEGAEVSFTPARHGADGFHVATAIRRQEA